MESSSAIRGHGDGVSLSLAITPRAGRDEITGMAGGSLRVHIKASPVEGKANEALLAFLAKQLGVPRSALSIVTGMSSRHKVVHASGVNIETARARLLPSAH